MAANKSYNAVGIPSRPINIHPYTTPIMRISSEFFIGSYISD